MQKKLSHHLLDGQQFYTLDPAVVIEAIVLNESEIEETNGFHQDVQSEILTKFAAIELLFPLEFRDRCKNEVEVLGTKSTYDLSMYFDIPEHLIEYALTDRYMKYSKGIWAQVSRSP